MKLIFCLDDRNGIAFNGRRQSRDRKVIDKTLENNRGKIISISPYSEILFKDRKGIKKTEDLSEEETVFIEKAVTDQMLRKADELEVYFWNRNYPGDSFVRIDDGVFEMTGEEEFEGYSHEKITVKKYIRRK